tara:strand:+ start:1065 stop:1262 length:198 start_codon:yes stop_codon:yes gene_type:complete
VLGCVAGLGASVTASVSSLIAVLVAAFCGWFYDVTLPPLALGLFIAGLLMRLFLQKMPPRTFGGD